MVKTEKEKQLENEARRATRYLKGKVVKRIRRYRDFEVVIQFEDGSFFFADSNDRSPLELSYHETNLRETDGQN